MRKLKKKKKIKIQQIYLIQNNSNKLFYNSTLLKIFLNN